MLPSARHVGVLAIGAAIALSGCALFKAASRPAPDLTIERTPARVKRGEYLANHVMACVSCHSTKDADHAVVDGKFGAGGQLFGREGGLPGDIYSTNLTADVETGLGGWTDGEVVRAIREGVSKDGHALFPLMPYTAYKKMSDDDVQAIVAYLRTLKPVKNAVPKRDLDFPLSVIVNTIPKPLEGPVGPPPTEQVAYGKHLLEMSSCNDCHTPMDKGQPIEGKYLAGGHSFKEHGKDIRLPNITQDPEAGIGKWTDKQIEDAIRFGQHPNGKRLNPLMPWPYYGGMSKEDMAAMIAYLRTVPPAK